MARQILIIKMSALGDVLHTLPALTDACRHFPDIRFDWVCEEPFSDVARLHPAVRHIYPHGRLRWKKKRIAIRTLREQLAYYRKLRQCDYDTIIDAQGRIKSARVGWLCKGRLVGLDKTSATDAETACFYKQGFHVPRSMNAVERIRQLFAQALGYRDPISEYDPPCFGIDSAALSQGYDNYQSSLIFFHGTTWDSKHWPEPSWADILDIARQKAVSVVLPWGNDIEKRRAEKLVKQVGWGDVLPRLSLWELFGVISRCDGAIGVDTGLMHVSAAIGIPTVSVFGSTSVNLTGACGQQVENMASSYHCSPCLKQVCSINAEKPPCYDELLPSLVWQTLQGLIER